MWFSPVVRKRTDGTSRQKYHNVFWYCDPGSPEVWTRSRSALTICYLCQILTLPSAETWIKPAYFPQPSAIQDQNTFLQPDWCTVSHRKWWFSWQACPYCTVCSVRLWWNGVVLLHNLAFHGVCGMGWRMTYLWRTSIWTSRRSLTAVCPSLSTHWHGHCVSWESNSQYKEHIKSCPESQWVYSIETVELHAHLHPANRSALCFCSRGRGNIAAHSPPCQYSLCPTLKSGIWTVQELMCIITLSICSPPCSTPIFILDSFPDLSVHRLDPNFSSRHTKFPYTSF